MDDLNFNFSGTLQEYVGKGSWFFITLPREIADEIKFFHPHSKTQKHKGFGSIRVVVRVGASQWKTSLFPYKKSASYLLPIKASIRAAETVHVGDEVAVSLSITESVI